MRSKQPILFFLIIGLLFIAPSGLRAELTIGQQAPDFSLQGVDGNEHSLSEYDGKYRVLEWTNYECPFVKKHYGSGNMQQLQKTYTEKGVIWLSVNSSAGGKQGYFSVKKWKKEIQEKNAVPTAVLLDASGKVGKMYGAQTTPHMYVIDPDGKLIYEGAIDSIPSADQGDIPKAKNYVSSALDESMSGQPVTDPFTKSYGCSVKY